MSTNRACGISTLAACTLIVVFTFVSAPRARSQCEAAMHSKSASASTNKCGYVGCGTGNGVVQVYLTMTEIQTGSYHYSDASTTTDGSYSKTTVTTNLRYPRHAPDNASGCVLWLAPEQVTCSGNATFSSTGQSSCSTSVDPTTCDWSDPICQDRTASILDELDYEQLLICSNVCLPNSYGTTCTYSSDSSQASESDLITLSSLFDDGMLRDEVNGGASYPTNWADGSGTAFWSLDPTHICGSGGKMQYQVGVPDSTKGLTYVLMWEQVTLYTDSSQPPTIQDMMEEIPGTGDPVNTDWGGVHEVPVPGTQSTITETAPWVARVFETPSSGGGGGGSGGPSQHGPPAVGGAPGEGGTIR